MAVNGVAFREMLVSSSKWDIKAPYAMSPKKITIHNTDNSASANNEVSYMIGNNSETGFHTAIDEKEAVQGIPYNRNAWHSGDGGNGYGNRNTIGIEICKNYDRNTGSTNLSSAQQDEYTRSEANAIKYVAGLCIQLGIVANTENIKRHYDWSGKWCPSKILNEGRWNIVQSLIIGEYNRLKGGGAVIPNPPTGGGNTGGGTVTGGNITVGSTVTVAQHATQYETKQAIPSWVRGGKYKVIQVRDVNISNSKKSYLLSGIMSWVLAQDLVESGISVGGGNTGGGSTGGGGTSIAVGSRVTLSSSAQRYATGEPIPNSIKGKQYTIMQVGSGRVLLKEILSWVNTSDVSGGGGSTGGSGGGGAVGSGEKAESGRFYPNTTINFRSAPSTSAPVQGQYHNGESVVYDRIKVAEGYVWISWIGGTGTRRWMAVRNQGGELWGRIVG